MRNRLRKIKKLRWLRFVAAALLIFFSFLVLNVLFPLPEEPDYSQTITDRNGELLHAFLTKDDKWRMYTELQEISPELRKAIIHKEDKYFKFHFGINPLAIARALFNNVVKRKRTSGASTITMQVARLLEPKDRTYWNKLLEMFRAIQLEWKYSKEEILQLYLNLVPYGGNIEGVKSASVLYYGKMPNHLSLAEITALSIVPNRPNTLTPGIHNDTLRVERDHWLHRFEDESVFPSVEIQDALTEPLNAERRSAPKLAPHFSVRMKYAYPDRPIVRTNLDLELQLSIENIVQNYASILKSSGISNAAVLVLENDGMDVLAYVGSADFYNNEDAGQVDGIRAIRQPGSTLKPLIYGLAFDEGLLTPQSVMTDVPVNFGGYRPVNYDKEFHGYVTVEQALAQSLNIPAVKTLDLLGVGKAVSVLSDAGFTSIKEKADQLGLSLVLGGCGQSLEEITSLYASFANEGVHRQVNFSSGKVLDTLKLLSPSSAFMLSEILQQLERPDLPSDWQNAKNLPKIAWKTGTSYGRRDAWSIGYNKDYTVGVWVGNFSGDGVPDLTGASKATPLLFEVFNTLSDPVQSQEWLSAPNELDFRLVCAQSGQVPSDQCTDKAIDYFIPLVSSNASCEHLMKFWVAANDSFVYCGNCLPEAGYKEVWMEDHPNEILAFYDHYGVSYKSIPPHNPDCAHLLHEGKAPVITNPSDDGTYYLIEDELEAMVFRAQAASDVENLFWYVDDEFIGSCAPGETFEWWPEAGYHTISCSDNKGKNTNIRIEINFIKF